MTANKSHREINFINDKQLYQKCFNIHLTQQLSRGHCCQLCHDKKHRKLEKLHELFLSLVFLNMMKV